MEALLYLYLYLDLTIFWRAWLSSYCTDLLTCMYFLTCMSCLSSYVVTCMLKKQLKVKRKVKQKIYLLIFITYIWYIYNRLLHSLFTCKRFSTTKSWMLNLFFFSICRYYHATINIGNPPKPYSLDIDTGSDVTWLQCDAPCSKCFPVIILSF